ncbi:hypothetical protein [Acinetobacter sp. Ver3]|uniref:hypothetical protein n=1 Tax=Acinetobacter sp. Ver3 TaxID=466088 RepID=UPI000447540C|nr:hypothetical protein [Acinetobacter sp. Ver3]EZQ10278.1 hypothetical protein CL42_07975 [Acinetobacter sp. Ver3]
MINFCKVVCISIFGALLTSHLYANYIIFAQSFAEIPSSKSLVNSICQKNELKCRAQDTKLYRVKNIKDSYYYLIDSSPKLVKFKKKGEHYIELNRWDFEDYRHSHQSSSIDDEFQSSGIKIYPALYPLSQNDLAIAIIDDRFVSYSGGGRTEQYADFVQLNRKGKYRLAVADQLFYASERIRACFSEHDYQTSAHCYDESGTVLNIHFKRGDQQYYHWTLNYTDYIWPAHESEKNRKVVKYSKKILPFNDLN